MLPDYALGSFVGTGDPVAKVISGKTIVRAYLNEEQLAIAKIGLGSRAHIRFTDRSGTNCTGSVISIAPANTEQFSDLSLTTIAEGEITLDPQTGQTQEPMFLVRVSVDGFPSQESRQDARAFILLGRQYESIGSWLFRYTQKLVNKVLAG